VANFVCDKTWRKNFGFKKRREKVDDEFGASGWIKGSSGYKKLSWTENPAKSD